MSSTHALVARTAAYWGALRALTLASLAALSPSLSAAAEQHPVVIVDARVLWTEPALADGGLVYALEVEDVIHGFAPGSVLVAREGEPTSEVTLGLGAFLTQRPGEIVRVEMKPRRDGLFDLVSAHALPPSDQDAEGTGLTSLSLAGTLPVLEAEPHTDRRGISRRIRSAVEDVSFEQEVVELVNEQRWSYGNGMLPPLKRVNLLDTAAEGHSSRMETQNFFSHCDLYNLSTPISRIAATGYTAAVGSQRENIAAGLSTPNEVMFDAVFGWMNSTGHQNNILATTIRDIGVGYVFNNNDQGDVTVDTDGDCDGDLFDRGPYRHYWTQNFAQRASGDGAYPVVINRESSSTTSQTVTLYVYGAGFATHMRFSNSGPSSGYSSWEPYSSAKSWTLSAGGGDKTVWAQLDSNGNGTPDHTASDTIYYDGSCSTTTLENTILDGNPATYQDCEIVAGPNVTVTGDTAFLADTVRLRSGFSVDSGVEFRIGPQP